MEKVVFNALFPACRQLVDPLCMPLVARTYRARPSRKAHVILHQVLWTQIE
jgi:hypothetical protein